MEQADLSGRIESESRSGTDPDDQRVEDTPSSTNTTDNGGQSSEVNKLRDSAVDDWVAEQQAQDENYGYFHLFVVAESSLTGIERHLRYEYEIDHPGPDDSQSEFHTRFGMGGARAETVHQQLVDWKLDKLAMPLHPELRDVPAERLRIFVAEPAREVLRKQKVSINPVVETLNQVDEHFPSKEQIERHREYIDAKEATTGVSGRLEQRVRGVENTIRARLGFTRQYGSSIPDPDSEYQHLGIGELEEQLRDARENVEQAEQREDELRREISEARSEWKDETRSELFS
jgi:hypothetical protein